MKLNGLFVVTHLCVALSGGVGGLLAVSITGNPTTALIVATASAMIVAVVTGVYVAHRTQSGFRLIETAIATGKRTPETGPEFDDIARRLQSHVQRWIDAASKGREQMREVETLMGIVDRRSSGRCGSGDPAKQLRQMLSGLANNARDTLHQIVICSNEIDRTRERIADGSQLQSTSVTKATRDIEQLSAGIDAVHQSSSDAHASALSVRDAYDILLGEVDRIADGMNRIRGHVITGESTNRLLAEHAQEIATIVDAIAELSSRTDMLALNASIESVRAGEFGRGFAVVAEEIRKLAEQTAEASRQVNERIEIIQLEIKDAADVTTKERAEVEREANAAIAVLTQLRDMRCASEKAVAQLASVNHVSQQQLGRVSNLVSSAEHLLNVARANLCCADETHHKTEALATLAVQLTDTIEPLARCGFGDPPISPDANVSTRGEPDACSRPLTRESAKRHLVHAS